MCLRTQALNNVDLCRRKHRQYLRYLRKLCGAFSILPSSFVLPPTSFECEPSAFASGGCSDVYKATFNGDPVVVKVLKVTTQTDKEKLYRVSGLCPKAPKQSLMPDPQLFVKEVVGWKWLRHENILPFLGVSLKPPLFSIISDRMENGSIMDFIRLHPSFNRFRLVSEGRSSIFPSY